MKRYDENQPIVVGLCGEAGTGKTSTAETIVPGTLIEAPEAGWDHTFLAVPLYSFVAIKQKMIGEKAKDRQRYATHELLVELLGSSPLWGAPKYKDLVALTKKIVDEPLPEGEKPRSFMQQVGDWLREINDDCFINYCNSFINNTWYQQRTKNELTDDTLEYKPLVIIVSDIRRLNEAKWIAGLPNGHLIKFTASDLVRKERLYDRDGHVMKSSQANHISERDVNNIPEEIIYRTINTDELNVAEQAQETRDAIMEAGELNA